jgi:hypothetical protein
MPVEVEQLRLGLLGLRSGVAGGVLPLLGLDRNVACEDKTLFEMRLALI